MNAAIGVLIGSIALGLALLIAGVYVLAGLGWSLMCAAGGCFAVSVLVARGMRGAGVAGA